MATTEIIQKRILKTLTLTYPGEWFGAGAFATAAGSPVDMDAVNAALAALAEAGTGTVDGIDGPIPVRVETRIAKRGHTEYRTVRIAA